MTSRRWLSPLRYPGGKSKLAPFVRSIIRENRIHDGCYIEPYAGGASVALDLLFTGDVRSVVINDLDPNIYAFWRSAVFRSDELITAVNDCALTIPEWRRQREILRSDTKDELSRGFATLFLNRTNRSGILKGGVIGGLDQTGVWKLDARFNRQGLSDRIRKIGGLRDHVDIRNEDAAVLVADSDIATTDSFVYLDPPYYDQGSKLYLSYNNDEDHKRIHASLESTPHTNWIVSYDNREFINQLYGTYRHFSYNLHYSANSSRTGREVMFFSDTLDIPALNTLENASQIKRVIALQNSAAGFQPRPN